LYTSNRELHRA